MRSGAWYYVGENDLFPQEFLKFLSMDQGLQSLFLQVHGELLTADYWRTIKARHLAGEVSVVVPYFRPALPGKSQTSIKSAGNL
jgi:isocitrate dehydrogenase kinase/phosphatase